MQNGNVSHQDTVSLRVLMVGPGRNVRGGVSSLVNTWYALGIDQQINLTYLPSMEDGGKLKKALVFAKALLRFPSLMRQHNILHVHLSPRASFARKAVFIRRAHRMGKRIIIHQHGGNFQDFYYKESSEKKQKTIRETFAMADRVIVLSEEWRRFFADGICEPQKLLVLHNGVVPPAVPKTDYADHAVLYLGQLTRMKGVFDLLDAVPKVLQALPDTAFYLCGDGDTEACHALVRAHGAEDRVRFPGWIGEEEKQKLFAACSVFVLPSYVEGMPMSLLEAMGHGLACVATPVGGIPQIMKDNESGLLTETGDANALANRLLCLLTDEAARRRIGENAAKTVRERFDARESLRQLLTIYRELQKDLSAPAV